MCLAFHQGGNLAVVAVEDQATFPVARYGSVIGRGRPLADRYRVARYFRCPPLRFNSRLTVEGARPSIVAIIRIERSQATPREISSRSASSGFMLTGVAGVAGFRPSQRESVEPMHGCGQTTERSVEETLPVASVPTSAPSGPHCNKFSCGTSSATLQLL